MTTVRPTEDIRPVTEFRAHAATYVQQVQDTKRPLILTQHGRSAAVLLDVEAYEALLDELALLRDIRTAEAQIDAGHGVAHGQVARQLRARLRA